MEPVIDFLGRLRPNTRNFDHLCEAEWNFLFQVFVKNDFAGAKILVDLVREIFSNAGNVQKGSFERQRFNIAGKTFDVERCPTISAHTERIGSLDFKQVGDLVEDETV